MTNANERLVDYLGLIFELCYLKPSGDAIWILTDKIRREDEIALEMIRIFNRFFRVGKSLDRAKKVLKLPGRDDGPPDPRPSNPSNNAPYAHCIGVRIRIKEHIASLHIRPGFEIVASPDAPRLSSGALLDANIQLQLDDPSLSILTTPACNISTKPSPSESRSRRSRRPKSGD
jgi:hypothetical protein